MTQRPTPYPRGVRFDCRDHSWCCDQNTPEYLDDDTLRLPLRLNQLSERENGLIVSVGVHEGNRPYMEDRHRVMYARDGHRGYFAVHDGHGGSEAAQYLAEHLYEDMITAIDEKLRSNKRFKSAPDEPSKRNKTDTSIKAPSSSSLASSSASEKSESSSPSKRQANGVVPKSARSSLASIPVPNTPKDQNPPLSGVAEASPSDIELADVTSPKADNSLELQNDASPSSANKVPPTSDPQPSQEVYLEDHETAETVGLVQEALREGCFSCESHLLDCARVHNFTSGSTSVSVYVRGNHLYAINVGDSRAVLCRNGQAVDLSNDHKPGVPSERQRIEEHEGEVGQMVKSLPLCCVFFGERERSVGAYRVWPGGLSVSRTFGDVNYKDPSLGKTHSPNILIADPEIKVMEITPQDEFMILATDGFWDVMSSQDAVKFLRKKKRKKKFVPARAGSMLCDRAYNYGSGDNITCIVVYFTHHCDSWARTPHRAPDQLTRIPYRADAACQTVQSIDASAQPLSSGAYDSDANESQVNGGFEVKTHYPNEDPDDSLPAAIDSTTGALTENPSTSPNSLSHKENSSPRRVSNSRSKNKSKRKSVSKSHSKSRPREATKRKSSRSSSYNRSPSKNDTRNGYHRHSLFEKKSSEQALASPESHAASDAKTDSKITSNSSPDESPATQASDVVSDSRDESPATQASDVVSDSRDESPAVKASDVVSDRPDESPATQASDVVLDSRDESPATQASGVVSDSRDESPATQASDVVSDSPDESLATQASDVVSDSRDESPATQGSDVVSDSRDESTAVKASDVVSDSRSGSSVAKASDIASDSPHENPAANVSDIAPTDSGASKENEASETSNTSRTPSQSTSQHGKSHRRERTEPTPASGSPYADVKDALKNRNSLPSPLTMSPIDAPSSEAKFLTMSPTNALTMAPTVPLTISPTDVPSSEPKSLGISSHSKPSPEDVTASDIADAVPNASEVLDMSADSKLSPQDVTASNNTHAVPSASDSST